MTISRYTTGDDHRDAPGGPVQSQRELPSAVLNACRCPLSVPAKTRPASNEGESEIAARPRRRQTLAPVCRLKAPSSPPALPAKTRPPAIAGVPSTAPSRPPRHARRAGWTPTGEGRAVGTGEQTVITNALSSATPLLAISKVCLRPL